MSWLSKLWPKANPPPEPAPARRPITIKSYGGVVISVPELDMMGQRSQSRNGRYRIIWQDRGWNLDQTDPRGRYVLLDDGVPVVDGRMDRPQHGRVADNGTFILNDWSLNTELSGTFTAFRADGNEIVSRAYAANLLNNGLSPDGRIAVCQTCNAPGSPDSSVLTVFDLDARAIISTWTAECGWADGYDFPESGDRICFARRDRTPLTFSLAGDFVDRKVWFEEEVSRGTLYVIRKALAEGEATTGVSPDALRRGVGTSLASDDDRFQAEGWRLLGEIEESAGDAAAAVEAYERALRINAKIGVSRRVAALRKRLV